jgi:ABC-2 type transport system ATP-binding protein
MSQNQAAISIQGLTKSYGEIQALRGVDLEVNRGEIYGFLGPNGAGKTTTIRCLLDLVRPQSGTVRVLGLDPRADSVAVRARIGYLPGELRLESNLKVEGALRYLNTLRGNKGDRVYMRQLAKRLELDLTMPIRNLSKGNKQKVGVVQALMNRPELLLLDEPTSGLDPLMQQEVHRLLKEAHSHGATVFFSSHFIREVETIAERVGIIRNGLIVEEAEPSQLGSMDLHRVHVRFMRPSDPEPLANVTGITVLPEHDDLNVTVHVEGELDGFIKALAAFPVSNMVIDRPSLEEIFLAYYEGDDEGVT